MLKFTEECLTGIEEIDREHQKLFNMINSAYTELNKSDADKRIICIELIRDLKQYASTHFVHEEEYMKQIHDPELSRQKLAHESFIARMNSLNVVGLSDENLKIATTDLLDYMSRWLFNHVIGSDTLIGKTESPFAFTEKYFVGVKLIDDEHKRLFEIMEEANQIIHDESSFDKYDEIMDIVDELREYTEFHFSDEERFMKEINYPDLDKQMKAHIAFIEKLNEIDLENIDDDQQGYLNDLLAFLLNWLTTHILKMDKKIGEFYKKTNN
ncbi:bacteriohemerythrin [Lachnobacterium bovis]|uniref:bacteriohemerythrin n=1 Tax=Lachnobacterium bovis TaxID=140626 RepID=UPI0003B3099A|nr:bacteriohemerythrin [Lachnobacterium bovis]